jgi:hypothetical protein
MMQALAGPNPLKSKIGKGRGAYLDGCFESNWVSPLVGFEAIPIFRSYLYHSHWQIIKNPAQSKQKESLDHFATGLKASRQLKILKT